MTVKTEARIIFKYTKEVFPLLDKISLVFVIEVLIQAGILISPLFMKVIIDYAYPNKDLGILTIFTVLTLATGIIVTIFTGINSFLNIYINQEFSNTFYKKIYAKMQRLPLGFFQSHNTGDLVYRITQDLEEVSSTILTRFRLVFTTLLKLVILLFIALSINPFLTFLALLGVPLNFLQTNYFSAKLVKIEKENRTLGAKIYDLLFERLANIKIIKAFFKGKAEVQRFLDKITDLFIIERKNIFTYAFTNFFSSIINRIWFFVLLFYTGFLVIEGSLTIGQAVVISTYISLLTQPFDALANLFIKIKSSMVAFKRVDEIITFDEEYAEDEANLQDIEIKGGIKFSNVGFSYQKQKQVLHNFDLEIAPKSSIALVGRSGIGKSSIVDIILKFYRVNSGQVLIDDVDINNLKFSQVRKQIGLVPQDVTLFSGTIRENLLFGLDNKLTEDEIIYAVKRADAYDFIMEQPLKLDTVLVSGGTNLSRGQRQRIAIARALLVNPKIIIFDEATSALDSESEKYIQSSIDKLKNNMTIIIIAHRLSTIKGVDKIAVIGDEGNIVEQGNFAELMQKKGVFFKINQLQSGGFYEFLQDLQLSIKSAQRYARPLSIAVFNIEKFLVYAAKLSERELVDFFEDIIFIISICIREVDYCSYEQSGLIWLSLPETDIQGAKVACDRIKNKLREKNLEVNYRLTQVTQEDTLDNIKTRLV